MATPEQEIDRLRRMNQRGLLGVQAAQGQLPGGLLDPALPAGATPPFIPPAQRPGGPFDMPISLPGLNVRTSPQGQTATAPAQPTQVAGPRPSPPAPQIQPAQMSVRDEVRNGVASFIAGHTGGKLPEATSAFVDEVANDMLVPGDKAGTPRGGFLGRLFGVDQIPGLTKDQHKQIRSEALISAGLTMLAQDPNVSFGQALATGVLAGRQAATTTGGALVDERESAARLAQYAESLRSADLSEREKWEEVRRRALVEGDSAVVDQVTDVLGELNDRPAEQLDWKRDELEDGTPVWVNEKTREIHDLDGNKLEGEDVAPAAPMISVEGRDFPDTPAGQQAALRWQEQMTAAQQAPQSGDAAKFTGDTKFLANRWDSEQVVKDSKAMAGAMARVNASVQDPSPAGDVALLFGVMKLNDPNSVVREGEFATAAETAGVPERIRNFYNRVVSGERLIPKQRKDFVDTAHRLARQQESLLLRTNERVSGQAQQLGVDPSLVIHNPFEGEIPTGPQEQGTPVRTPAIRQGIERLDALGRP